MCLCTPWPYACLPNDRGGRRRTRTRRHCCRPAGVSVAGRSLRCSSVAPPPCNSFYALCRAPSGVVARTVSTLFRCLLLVSAWSPRLSRNGSSEISFAALGAGWVLRSLSVRCVRLSSLLFALWLLLTALDRRSQWSLSPVVWLRAGAAALSPCPRPLLSRCVRRCQCT